jgi:hypothetical protein
VVSFAIKIFGLFNRSFCNPFKLPFSQKLLTRSMFIGEFVEEAGEFVEEAGEFVEAKILKS